MDPVNKNRIRRVVASFIAAAGYIASFVVLSAALFFMTGVQTVFSALGPYTDVHIGFALLLSLTWTLLTVGAVWWVHVSARKFSGDVEPPDPLHHSSGRILAWSLGSLVCFLYWYSSIPGNLKVMNSIKRSAEAVRNSNGR